MEIKLIRFRQTKDSTIGRLYAGPFECYVLEDGHRDVKEPGKTRIPAGRYKIECRFHGGLYERYTKQYKESHPMLELKSIPGFTDVLIHTGNTVLDTMGCLLVGTTYSLVGGCFQILESKKAYDALRKEVMPVFAKEDVFILITEDFV
jgi:hypothetical protein